MTSKLRRLYRLTLCSIGLLAVAVVAAVPRSGLAASLDGPVEFAMGSGTAMPRKLVPRAT